ncbi:Uncharacterised protein [Mycobacterium tuberculosis]|nr:Uncharacterised protein [Mycobacterium tuberculosis]CKR22109.1 Uncharacterised protein [Mycobacterium tuberculosis]
MAATSAAHISSYTPSAAAINGAFCPNKFVITSCTNASRLAPTAAGSTVAACAASKMLATARACPAAPAD